MKQDNLNNLIEEHIALVKKIASKYRNYDVPFDDLVQEGLLGLLEAKDKYIPDKNAKFSTYAVYWIKKRIIEFVNKENKSRIPNSDNIENVAEEIHDKEMQESKIVDLPGNLSSIEKKVIKLFFEEHKTLNEISELLGIRRERVRQIKQKALRKLKINKKITEPLYSINK